MHKLQTFGIIKDFSDHQKPFQIIRKLPRPSGHFPDYLENFQTFRKLSRLSGNFADSPKIFPAIRKLSGLSRKYPDYPESFQAIRKFSRLSGNFPGYPETFQVIQKLSRLSGNFPDHPETFQAIWKIPSAISSIKGNAQKLSGRAKTFRMAMPRCHDGFCASGGGRGVGGVAKVVWNVSKNSSDLVAPFVPYKKNKKWRL